MKPKISKAADMRLDAKLGIKDGSKKDRTLDRALGVKDMTPKAPKGPKSMTKRK